MEIIHLLLRLIQSMKTFIKQKNRVMETGRGDAPAALSKQRPVRSPVTLLSEVHVPAA